MRDSKPLLTALVMFWAFFAAGCNAPGPFTARTTVDVPGMSAQQMDEGVARPVAGTLYRASGGIREVISISTAGQTQFYATSDRGVKQEEFLQALTEAMSEAIPVLPDGAAAGPVSLLAPGQTIPNEPPHPVGHIRIDFDRAKMIDAGVTVTDVTRAIGRARESAAGETGNGAASKSSSQPTTGPLMPTARGEVDTLAATTLPSRAGPVTLGNVATIRVVTEPDRVVRHWP